MSSSHIVFVNDQDGDKEIYSVNPDGSRLVQLTKNRWDDDEVSASPGGRRLALTCGNDQVDLCVIGSDGRRLRRLKDAWPAGWSPDGSKLAYQDETGLAVVSIDGAKLRLTRSADETFIDWSPDGRLVLVARSSRTSYGRDDLYTVCLADGTSTKVASGIDSAGIAWSPRTSTIVYESGDELFLYDAANGTTRKIYSRAAIYDVAWSPDGTMLAVSGTGGSPGSKASVEILEARDLDVLARAPSGYGVLWSPDSRYLAVGHEYGDGTATSILTIATRDVRRLRRQLVDAWSPDSNWIAHPGYHWSASGVSIINASDGRRRAPFAPRGETSIVGWFRGPVPRRAQRAGRLPAIEVASRTAFRSRGAISELSASGSRVAIVIEQSRLDRPHVVVWTAQTVAVARESPPTPGWLDSPTPTDLQMRGRRVYWADPWDCGISECNRSLAFGLLRGPQKLTVKYEGQTFYQDETEPDLPWQKPAPVPTREHPARVGSVSMFVSGRCIYDGRQTVCPPGKGPVLARLTRAGVFYAYNGRGPFRGHVAFVPFVELR